MGVSQKEKIMEVLGVSAEEADDILAYDKQVDQGKATEYDLTADQEKVAKKMRQADRKPFVPKFTKRERKPNATKGALIEEFFNFLQQNSQFSIENLAILNKERQIAFSIGEDKFEITLTQKRKPKN